jgi:cholesterol oxidase
MQGEAQEHFDAVIVGSGFGGSVMACRLAQAGWRVCLLERGKAYPPGSFPRTPRGVARNFWSPSEGTYGMFDVWSFRGLEGLVSSGLGGGSLIYANVALRKDEHWFVHDRDRGGYETWPVTRADLDPHYDEAERMLAVQRFPFHARPYSETPKTRAMQHAAKERGLDWMLPPLTITFGNDGEAPVPGEPIREPHGNLHGRTRLTCTLCGECDAGCNTGSKNTLDYTYLSAAQRAGAELRTLCEVKTFAPRAGGKGFTVSYVRHDLEREGTPLDTGKLPRTTITATRLILSAGTFGSTYLLLRNREAFGGVHPLLGTRFCGNGDLLSFAIRCRESKDGVERGRTLEPSNGPVITSAIRYPDALDDPSLGGARGMYLEDAGYPAFMGWLAEATDTVGFARRAIHFAWQRIRARLGGASDSSISDDMSRLLGECALSSDSLPLLGMGRDTPDGVMRLSEGWLDIDWGTRNSSKHFERMRGAMRDIVDTWGGKFVDNPMWFFKRVITVHPLGGCPMGRHTDEGVTDEWGEVYGVPGLYVADGSVMPGPVGANPSLTIAALAERFAERMVERGR